MSAGPVPQIRQTLVVGAGFSRAISAEMPLTADLIGPLRDAGFDPPQDVEGWLTYLASDQPFLRKSENLEKQALFLDVSEQIARIIHRAGQAARRGPAPDWLYDLVAAASFSSWPIVDFNYDCLPETLGRELGSPIEVLKLHGSIDESWDPDDLAGVPPVSEPDTTWTPGRDASPLWMSVGRHSPFVVPPVSSKSAFYRVPDLRDRWLRAMGALRTTDAVSVLGYSLPPNDHSTSEMLRSALGDRGQGAGARVAIADLDADTVAARLTDLGLAPHRRSTGSNAIAQEVQHLCLASLHASIDDLRIRQLTHPDAHLDADLVIDPTGVSPTGQAAGTYLADHLGPDRPIVEWLDVMADMFANSPRWDEQTVVGFREGGWADKPRLIIVVARRAGDR